jgi:WD40 repeat protein
MRAAQGVLAGLCFGLWFANGPAWGAPQDKTAENAYRKVVESIGKAKTLSVKFQCEMTTVEEGKQIQATSSGFLRLKEGNRLTLVYKAFRSIDGKQPEFRLVSSGAQMKFTMALDPETQGGGQGDAPSEVAANLQAGLSRLGLGLPLIGLTAFVGHGEIPLARGVPDLVRNLEASEFKGGKGDGGALKITHLLRDKSPGIPAEVPPFTCTIWYEPRTFKVLKRSFSLKQGPGEFKLVETYGEFVVNGAVPDAEFALPEPPGEKPLQSIVASPTFVASLAFSPDGKTLVAASAEGRITLWETSGGKLLRELPGRGSQNGAVVFSPDGKTLAAGYSLLGPPAPPTADGRMGHEAGVRIWDAASGKEVMKLVGINSNVPFVRFGPDGKTLASAGEPITIRDLTSGKKARSLTAFAGQGGSLAFSPDFQTFALQVNDSFLLWDVATDKVLRPLSVQQGFVSRSAFSLDGKVLAGAFPNGTIRLWETASGKELRTFAAHAQGVGPLAFSPDGSQLASGGGDKAVKLWNVADGRQLRLMAGHADGVHALAFSPDGKTLATGGGGTIRFWSLTTAPAPLPAPPPAPERDPSLVGYWKLDEKEGTTAIDSSGQGNAGTYVNAPEFSADVPTVRFSNPGCRIFVQGKGQSVEVPDSESLRLTGSLTLAAWVRPAAEVTESHHGIIDDKFEWSGDEARGGYFLRLSARRNLLFHLIPASGGGKGCWSPPIPPGTWTHVAGVYDAKTQTARAYVNGMLVGTETSVAPPGPTNRPLRIGANGVNQLHGSLDEVRVYNRALSEAEIRSLAHGAER